MERDAFWRKVVEAKYGNLWGSWCTWTVRGSYRVSLWKAIRKEWDRFVPFISFRVGDGESVKFWHDKWCGGFPFKVLYPELFSISRDRDASVAALSSFRNGKLHWEISFSQNVEDWELEFLSSFMDLIYSLTLDGNGMDKLCWNGMKHSGFTVQSYYRCLSPSFTKFLWKAVWKPKVPSQVACFIWTAVLGKIPIIDNLGKRNMVLVNRCCLCKACAESVDHLLLHCPLAMELWDLVLSLFGVSWVMPH
jgi:hypothetical protein